MPDQADLAPLTSRTYESDPTYTVHHWVLARALPTGIQRRAIHPFIPRIPGPFHSRVTVIMTVYLLLLLVLLLILLLLLLWLLLLLLLLLLLWRRRSVLLLPGLV